MNVRDSFNLNYDAPPANDVGAPALPNLAGDFGRTSGAPAPLVSPALRSFSPAARLAL